jgi:hypothetical protein
MKSKLFLFVVALLVISQSFSQTNVSGAYFSNEIWTIGGSPYRVVGDVQIPIGYSLTIEPGVIVEYTGEFEILIKGELNSIGTENDSIVYLCSPDISLGVTMLRFKDIDLSNSGISYSRFSNSEKALIIEGSSSNTLLVNSSFFSHSEILNHGTNSILLMNNICLKDVLVENPYGNNYSQTTINNSIIDSCNLKLKTGNNSPGMLISTSQVTNSSFLSGVEMAEMELNDLTCDNCTYSTYYGKLTINDSRLINSGFNNHNTSQQCQVFFDIKRSFLINTSIESTVTNPNNEWWSTINIDSCIIKKDSSTLMGYQVGNISNSIIIGTYNNPGIQILMGEFNKTTLVNNHIGVSREDNNLTFSITNSNFFHNLTYNLQNNSEEGISGIYNFWGTTDIIEIEELIYDYFDDINLGEVDFSNYQIVPNNDCPISPPNNLILTEVPEGHKLSWDPNPEGDIAGYKLYYGTFNGFNFQYSVDIGNDTAYSIPINFNYDTIAITAYDEMADGSNDMVGCHESWYSISTNFLFQNTATYYNSKSKCIVSPNPVSKILKIQVTGFSDILSQVDIIDINGVVLYSIKEYNTSEISIDVSTYPNGVYLVKTIVGNSIDFHKMLKI